MQICPKCHADVPEQMLFCLQCGAPLSPLPPPAAPSEAVDPQKDVTPVDAPASYAEPFAPAPESEQPPHWPTPTVPLKIAPTPVLAPRAGLGPEYAPHRLRDQMVEVDEESLKKSFERQPSQPGAVLCRFCKSPLDLAGDFCDQCGAPVAEAAPPGTSRSTPQAAAPRAAPAPVPDKPTQAAPPAPPVENAPADQPCATSPSPSNVATLPEPNHPTPIPTPAPEAPIPPPTPPAEALPSGLMGRLKGIFKKG